jgi:hypothetical protein
VKAADLRCTEVVGRVTGSDDRALAAALVSAGFTSRDAEFLVALVPLALSRPILEQLGVSHFADTAVDDYGIVESRFMTPRFREQ